jgi:hypothetical protein
VRPLLAAAAALLLTGSAGAYTSAPPQSLAVPATGGRFVFAVLAPGGPDRPRTPAEAEVHRHYPASGMYEHAPGRPPELRWAVGWYSDTVVPAADGRSVVRVNAVRGVWLGEGSRQKNLARVAEMEAAAVYAEGRLVRRYTVGELFDVTRFTDAQLGTWFGWFRLADPDNGSGVVTLESETGERVALDARTGAVVPARGAGEPVAFCGNGPAAGLWVRWTAAAATGVAVAVGGGAVVAVLLVVLARRPRA